MQKKGKLFSPDPSTWEGGYIAANGSSLYQPAGISALVSGRSRASDRTRGRFEETRTTRTGSRAAGQLG